MSEIYRKEGERFSDHTHPSNAWYLSPLTVPQHDPRPAREAGKISPRFLIVMRDQSQIVTTDTPDEKLRKREEYSKVDALLHDCPKDHQQVEADGDGSDPSGLITREVFRVHDDQAQ